MLICLSSWSKEEKSKVPLQVRLWKVPTNLQSKCWGARPKGKIQVRLANGLAAFEESDQVSVITIAGMGGRLIARILEEGLDKLANVERLILQPNNREDDLRIWLQENGFQIVAESILEEAGKFYEILVVEAGQMNLSASDVRFGPFLSKEVSPVFVQKWQKEAIKLEFALGQIPDKNLEERQVLVDKIQAIKEVLHVSKWSD